MGGLALSALAGGASGGSGAEARMPAVSLLERGRGCRAARPPASLSGLPIALSASGAVIAGGGEDCSKAAAGVVDAMFSGTVRSFAPSAAAIISSLMSESSSSATESAASLTDSGVRGARAGSSFDGGTFVSWTASETGAALEPGGFAGSGTCPLAAPPSLAVAGVSSRLCLSASSVVSAECTATATGAARPSEGSAAGACASASVGAVAAGAFTGGVLTSGTASSPVLLESPDTDADSLLLSLLCSLPLLTSPGGRSPGGRSKKPLRSPSSTKSILARRLRRGSACRGTTARAPFVGQGEGAGLQGA
mmetsp:Transcript_95914/g.309671  ORF Transcript_95914/g.309671 Transcript_95914/m.309671 type:complete len:308 (-) Transcript_95914:343-1266(-)